MGYHTDFDGSIQIEPPLSAERIEFLTKFSQTRRMHRTNGPHFVDGTGDMGQGQDPDILNYNQPDPSQPGLWCNWIPTEDGTAIEWDYGEKFYKAAVWMDYIIQNYIIPYGHVCNGVINACGEDPGDLWQIHVVNNVVTTKEAVISYV